MHFDPTPAARLNYQNTLAPGIVICIMRRRRNHFNWKHWPATRLRPPMHASTILIQRPQNQAPLPAKSPPRQSTRFKLRRQRYLKARLQLAHYPNMKTFEQFDFGFQPSIDERQIRELRTLRFVHEASNVILLGPPGVGKTHLAVALAVAAVEAAHGAYFITAHDL